MTEVTKYINFFFGRKTECLCRHNIYVQWKYRKHIIFWPKKQQQRKSNKNKPWLILLSTYFAMVARHQNIRSDKNCFGKWINFDNKNKTLDQILGQKLVVESPNWRKSLSSAIRPCLFNDCEQFRFACFFKQGVLLNWETECFHWFRVTKNPKSHDVVRKLNSTHLLFKDTIQDPCKPIAFDFLPNFWYFLVRMTRKARYISLLIATFISENRCVSQQ